MRKPNLAAWTDQRSVTFQVVSEDQAGISEDAFSRQRWYHPHGLSCACGFAVVVWLLSPGRTCCCCCCCCAGAAAGTVGSTAQGVTLRTRCERDRPAPRPRSGRFIPNTRERAANARRAAGTALGTQARKPHVLPSRTKPRTELTGGWWGGNDPPLPGKRTRN